jgi:peroxiredoxin
MTQDKWKGSVEVVTNLAVLLVAVVVLATFAKSYFAGGRSPRLEAGLRKGEAFSPVRGLDYGGSPLTLLIVMNTNCHYCTESVPFYRKLAEAQRTGGRAARVVAVFPNDEAEVREYARQTGLDLEKVSGVDFSKLNVGGTPTAILIDSGGTVRDFWVGKLPSESEQQIINALGEPAT